ncbi:MAG: response regulator [Kofleriaceae bacterium]
MIQPRERATLLLIHRDGAMLDQLTQLFEGRGFDVKTAATSFQAHTHLESATAFAAVVAQWDPQASLGGEVYRWALKNRPTVRGQFVFLSEAAPEGFDELVAGRCLAIDPGQQGELARVVDAAVAQAARLDSSDGGDASWLDAERPTLLLADDDPVLLTVIAQFLGDAGFAVTPVDSGEAAIAQLRLSDYHVVLADWSMENGSGGDLLRWITDQRPSMVSRLAFLSSSSAGQAQAEAKGCRAFSKGQDSRGLIAALSDIARGA